MKKKNSYRLFLTVFVLFLICSIHGVTLLPAWPWRGLDLQNFHAFHTACGKWPIPYELTGADCGDALGRPMIYPPLLYWVMGWVRAFDFYRADLLWSVAIFLMTLLGTAILASADRGESSLRFRFRDSVLWAFLLFQLPMAYALERGNSDAVILPVYSAAILFFLRRSFVFSGFLLGTACWLKVYPAISSLLLLTVLGIAPEFRNRSFKPLLKGFLIGGVTWAVVLLPDSFRYVFSVLPEFANRGGGIQPHSHILYKSGWSWIFLKLPILFFWGRMTMRNLEKDPILVLSGGLAISTFFQTTSNDYNFITAYPFLFVLLSRLLRVEMKRGDLGMLVLTFLVFVGDRTLWVPIFGNRGVLYWQILWLFIFPLFIDRKLGGTALTNAPRVTET